MADLVFPDGLSREQYVDLEQMASNTDWAVQAFFRIKNKSNQIVDLEYNQPQKLHSARSTDNDAVLKARKVGISSRRIPGDLWKCATRKNEHRILLTHSTDGAEKMMVERVKPAIELCKFPLGAVMRKDYIFFPGTGSRYYVGTAGAKAFGRGSDLTGKHLTEIAHWENPDVLAGVEEAMVEGSDSLIETTANGHNFFKKLWDAAKKGRNQYRAIFLPWYADEGYVRDPALEPGIVSEEERQLIDVFQLTSEQIAWRRWKKRTMSDPALFPQEYPETDEQAFLSSGRPVFDWLALERVRKTVSEPKWRGYLSRTADRIVFNPDPKGDLRVWKIPERNHVYAIGSDVAEGLKDGAYSTGEVLDLGDSEQVAEWHGHIAPDLFADTLELLAAWFNQAIIIPESYPGPGEVTTSHLLAGGRVRVWDGIDADRPGFHTDLRSKPMMIASFGGAIRDFQITIRSQELLDECHSFVYDDRGRMGPSSGNFSDRVMGMGIAWYTTRDMAARVDYYKALRPIELGIKSQLTGGGTSVPRWRGPRLGVRSE